MSNAVAAGAAVVTGVVLALVAVVGGVGAITPNASPTVGTVVSYDGN